MERRKEVLVLLFAMFFAWTAGPPSCFLSHPFNQILLSPAGANLVPAEK